jgi:hypothetical protein
MKPCPAKTSQALKAWYAVGMIAVTEIQDLVSQAAVRCLASYTQEKGKGKTSA